MTIQSWVVILNRYLVGNILQTARPSSRQSTTQHTEGIMAENKDGARRRQELRRSNATVPIPSRKEHRADDRMSKEIQEALDSFRSEDPFWDQEEGETDAK
jgi:hypothetical protein